MFVPTEDSLVILRLARLPHELVCSLEAIGERGGAADRRQLPVEREQQRRRITEALGDRPRFAGERLEALTVRGAAESARHAREQPGADDAVFLPGQLERFFEEREVARIPLLPWAPDVASAVRERCPAEQLSVPVCPCD